MLVAPPGRCNLGGAAVLSTPVGTTDAAAAFEERKVPGRHYERAAPEELLRWAQAGDGVAFGWLVRPHQRLMGLICRRITGNDQDALDACQEALVKAWRAIGRFEGGPKLSAWLYVIATNAAIGVVRKRRIVTSGEIDVVDRSDPAREVSDRSSIDWALAQLPPQFRAALILREYGDLSYEEIGAALGIPVNTVKSQISRARQALRRLLLEVAE